MHRWSMNKRVKRIAITGGAGQIAYSLMFRIANGDLFGTDQPIALQILEVEEALPSLKGTLMELEDCCFPLLQEITSTSDPYQAFAESDVALLIGAKPRSLGMERKDLLHENRTIFITQGKALNEVANSHVKVVVVGNPCNTNCLLALQQTSRLSKKNFYAMTRLDQNRASFLLAQRGQVPTNVVSHMTIWGNHSSTQVPDFINAQINNKPVQEFISDTHWLEHDFIQLVQNRGTAVIEARKKSSAASAAHAVLQATRDVLYPTDSHNWFSMGVLAEGNPYGIQKELVFSFPCRTDAQGEVSIVKGLEINDFLANKLHITEKELMEEKEMARA
jgi:malate dehydrogenase